LAFEAVVDAILAAEPTPDTGSLEGDLAGVAASWVRLSNARRGSVRWHISSQKYRATRIWRLPGASVL
jgi:hypothetical protein